MEGLDAMSMRDSWIWPLSLFTASPNARAMANRRSSVGTHRNSRIGNVAEVCTMAWNVFSVVSMTYPPAAGAPPACPGPAFT